MSKLGEIMSKLGDLVIKQDVVFKLRAMSCEQGNILPKQIFSF